MISKAEDGEERKIKRRGKRKPELVVEQGKCQSGKNEAVREDKDIRELERDEWRMKAEKNAAEREREEKEEADSKVYSEFVLPHETDSLG